MVSLAIIGARTFTDYTLLCEEVKSQCYNWDIKISDIKTIVGGHCKGADLLGEKFARDNGIPLNIFYPDWKKHGKSAGIIRNYDIIANATHVIAFPSVGGSGTQHSIRLAQKAGKPYHVVSFDK
jgi:hypothetical protein